MAEKMAKMRQSYLVTTSQCLNLREVGPVGVDLYEGDVTSFNEVKLPKGGAL